MKFHFKTLNLALLIAVILAVPFAQMPGAHSVEVEASEKTLLFLRNVAGLDLAKYNSQVRILNVTSNSSGLFDTMVKFNLTSTDTKLDVVALFRNNALVWCKLYPIQGSPLFAQQPSADALDSAKNILDKVQNYTATAYLPTLKNMLNAVTNLSKTITLGNVAQDISVYGNTENFKWSYKINGIENNYKVVALTLQNGSFQFFFDNWDLYKIGNADMRVLREEAIQIAKDRAYEHYSTAANQSSTTFTIMDKLATATLSMQDRGNYTLYPHWEILLPLDKAYGVVSAIRVNVWADTGKVAFMAAIGMGGVPPTEQSGTESASTLSQRFSQTPMPAENGYAIITAIIATSVAITGCLFRKRKT